MTAKYEIFLHNGASFTIDKVKSLDVEFDDASKVITKLSLVGSDVKDTLEYINIAEIVCIVKRKENRWT